MNDIAIPEYMRKMMAEGSAVSNLDGTNVASSGVPRISTKGKLFRLKEGDVETKAGQSINVIIIGMNPEGPKLAHTYYADGYTPDASEPPNCSSYNGSEPDNWIVKPQSKSCFTCPQAVWGSAKSMSGGKSKACKDSKHLYVAMAEEFSKDPENAKLWLLQVTVNSLKNFSNYGKVLQTKGIPGTQFCITTISFNEEASVPQLEFAMVGLLDEKHGKAANDKATKSEWKQISLPSSGPSNRTLEAPEPKVTQTDDKSSLNDLVDEW
jgi:hypothetical protein